MENKYVRGLVYVIAGTLILIGLLFVGDFLNRATSGSTDTSLGLPSDAGQLPYWWVWMIIGAVLVYAIYVFLAERDMFQLGTREVVMMAIGAALYGVLTWVFNIIPVPSVSLVALRPVVVIPIFFGFVFGPAVGFFTGAFGNVLGDAISGWGVYPIWDFANGLMGLIPGLAGLYMRNRPQDSKRIDSNILLWIAVAGMAIATVMLFLNPEVASNFTGESLSNFQFIMPLMLIVTVALAFAPKYWPYILGLFTLGLLVWGILNFTAAGNFSVFGLVLILLTVIVAAIAGYLYQHSSQINTWLDGEDTRTLVVWGALAVVIGIGFAAIADIFYNGYSVATAIVGEFIPAAGPNLLFAVILTPLIYAAWKQTRAQAGR